MFSACIFCHSRLGANEAVEHFPVGRRLAFDAAKGRLWVICANCKQWNLSPFEERWEAIEEAERLYRDARLRASTDEIGLARLREGTELVRIGRPLLPEFAAWRYGDRFTRRWVRNAIVTTTTLAIGYSIGPVMGLSVGVVPYAILEAVRRRIMLPRFAARIERGRGTLTISHEAAARVRIEAAPHDPLGWRLLVPVMPSPWTHHEETDPTARIRIEGDRAVDAMRQLMPQVNVAGGRRANVRAAVSLLEEAGSMRETLLRAAARTPSLLRSVGKHDGIATLPTEWRLALEMALHEDVERRALDGELHRLQSAWETAEEIAAISDSLTLPRQVVERWSRLTGRQRTDGPG